MSGYRRVNYYELCRLCTSNKGTKLHMFKEEGKRRQIATKIQICLRLQVNEQDSLPKLICNLCLEKVEGYFDFRSSCVNAEAMLESYARNLSLNSGFVMDGKVYIKENKLDASEGQNSNKGIILSNTAQAEALQLKESEIKISSQSNEIVSLPVSLDSLGRLVQAATIHILPEKELAKLQSNLKGTIQVQQNVDKITGEHSYSYNVQGEVIEEDTVNQKINQNINNCGTTNPCIQMEKVDSGSQSSEFVEDNEPDKCRNSVNQIGEFLKLETVTGNEETEDGSCENCGLLFSSHFEKRTHSEVCSAIDDSLKVREPVVVVNVEDVKSVVNCWSFTCEECGKIFKRKEHLVQHRRLHTGERPFHCSYCSSTFSRKEHLVRHIVCHTGEKHYSCGICGKLFGRKDNVGKHLRTHQIKPLFITDSCGVSATFSKEEISTLSYKCDLCGNHFSTEEFLKKHLLTHSESDKCSVMVLNSEQPVSILEKALKQSSE